jgi:HAD superfamily hydrolase (TIGR01509 family)
MHNANTYFKIAEFYSAIFLCKIVKKIKVIKMKKQAIVWDIDGTLVESEQLHFTALQNFIKDTGGKLTGNYKDFIGKSLTNILEKYVQTTKVIDNKKAVDSINTNYSKLIKPKYVRDGIKELMSTIYNDRKIRQACASNGERKVVTANLNKTGLNDYVEFAISGEDVVNSKPDPEIYQKACKQLNIHPNNVIAVEDSELGVKAAKKAGLLTIAFPNEDTKHMDFSCADFIANDLSELKKNIFNNI